MKKFLSVILLFLSVQCVFAQNITIENFEHLNNPFLKRMLHLSSVTTDKNNAIVDFKTEKKGFKFATPKISEIEAEEGDGIITVKLPHKTKFVIVSHPEYGEFTWRVPVEYLKKKNHYTADLFAIDLTKDFNIDKQWLIMNISPENSLLTIDSTEFKIRNGRKESYLPLGKHYIKIESPFYETIIDSVEITSDKSETLNYFLQPEYSYLTVRLKDMDGRIFVNGEYIKDDEVTSLRLEEGNHRISVNHRNNWIVDSIVTLERAEKKVVVLDRSNLKGGNYTLTQIELPPNTPNSFYEFTKNKQNGVPETIVLPDLTDRKDQWAEVSLKAEDENNKIFINREYVATGSWTGRLPYGFHLLTTEKERYESIAQFIEIKDSTPQEIELVVPKSGQAIINLHGNVDEAQIIFNNEIIGITPMLIKDVEANESHTFTIKKDGFKDKTLTVRPKGNDITNLYFELIKK